MKGTYRQRLFAIALSSCCYSSYVYGDYTVTTASSTDLATGINQLVSGGVGGNLYFDPSLDGSTITLTSGILPFIQAPSQYSFNINPDAAAFVTISGSAANPIFYIAPGTTATFTSLLLTKGFSVGGPGGDGASTEGGAGGGGGMGAGAALFINGTATVTLTDVQFMLNQSLGGSGGSGDFNTANLYAGGAGGGGGAFYGGTAAGGGGAIGQEFSNAAIDGGAGGGGGNTPGVFGNPAELDTETSGAGGNGGGSFGGAGGYGVGIFPSAPGGPGGDATGIFSGGGGGGGASVNTKGGGQFFIGGTGGAGADFGGGGGGGGSYNTTGNAQGSRGGTGGFGAGGGGFGGNSFVSGTGPGGNGGFGGGGGGFNGVSLYSGGQGTASNGGGGAGLGGAIFVRNPASLTIQYTNGAYTPLPFQSNVAVGGIGGNGGGVPASPGGASGPDIFLNAGGGLTFIANVPFTIATPIDSDPEVIAQDLPIIVQGNDVLTLGGNNTFAGGVTINANGTLSVSSDSNLGLLTVNDGLLTLDTGTIQISSNTFNTQRDVFIGSGGGTMTNTSGVGSTGPLFAGDISSSLAGNNLLISGGTIAFGGGNNYTSNTLIASPGSLLIYGTPALSPDTNITLLGSSALLQFKQFSGSYSNDISGTGAVTLDQGVALDLEGINTYAGSMNIAFGATLSVGTFQSLSSTASITDNGALVVNVPSPQTLSPTAIAGGGVVIMGGDGNLLLSSQNSYTGGTFFNTGNVQISATSALGGGTATFSGGTLEILNPVSGVLSIPVQLNSNGGVLQLDGGVGFTASGVWGGLGGISTQGSGKFTLQGTSNYVGNTTIGSGTQIVIPVITALPQGNFTDNGLLTLSFDGGAVPNSIAGGGALVVGGSGTQSYGGVNTYSGTTTIGSSATMQLLTNTALPSTSVVTNNGILDIKFASGTVANSITGPGQLWVESFNSAVLTGVNTYGGTTLINSSANLFIGATASLAPNSRIQDDGTLTFQYPSGILAPTAIQGVGSVVMNGTGTLLLSDDDTYSGGTVFNNGTTQISSTGALGSGVMTFSGGTLELLNPFSGTFGVTATINAGGGTILIDSGVSATASADWIINGPLMLTGPGVFSWIAGASSSGNGVITVGTETTLFSQDAHAIPPGSPIIDQGLIELDFASGTVGNSISGSGSVSILQGLVSYTGVKTYSGTTTIDPGATLDIRAPGAYPTNSRVVDNGLLDFQFTSTSLQTIVAAPVVGSGALEVIEGTVRLLGANTYGGTTTIDSSGILQIGTSLSLPAGATVLDNGQLIFQNVSGTVAPGAISGVGSVSMNGTGGAVTLTATDSYTNGTYFNSGTVQIFDATALGSGDLFFAGGVLELSNPFTGPISAIATLNTNGGTVQVDSGVSALYSGAIGGVGALAVRGGGTLQLSGPNDYGSTTSVAVSTTLEILDLSSLPSTSVVTDNGILTFNVTTNPANIGNQILGSGVVEVIGASSSSIYTITNTSNQYSGGTIIDTGILQASTFANLGSGPIGFLNGGTLELQLGGYNTSRGFNIGTGGGNLLLDAGASLTYSGSITGGADPFHILGIGQMTYSGASTLLGTTTLGSGSLSENTLLVLSGGSFSGPFIVSAGSTLQGHGSTGNLTNNGTIVMSATDEITVNGSYTQDVAGVWEMGIRGNGQNSFLGVANTATLDGALVVTAKQGAYAFGTTYTILTAGDPLTTTFADVQLPSFPQLVITYYPDPYITLTVISQSVLSGASVHGHNPQQVLNNLQQIIHTPSSDLVNVIDAMSDFDSGELTEALNQLHPAPFGSFELLNVTTMSMLSSIFGRHSGENCCLHINSACSLTDKSLWLQPFGYLYSQGKIGEQIGFDANSMGLAGGLSFSYVGGLLLGAGAAYSTSHLDWHQDRGNGTLDKTTLSIYGDYARDRFSLQASVLGSLDIVTASRHIEFSTIDRSARHQRSGYDLTLHIGGGGDFAMKPFFFRPFANLDYLYFYQKGFTEHGANSLDLEVRGKRANMLRSEVGLELSSSWKMGESGCFSPLLFVSGINECYLIKKHYISNFAGENPTFAVRPFNKPIYLLSPGAELDFVWSNGLSFALRYQAELNGAITINKLDARFEWFF